jgi:uncharacterized ferritin-like protein (DUF455 family)
MVFETAHPREKIAQVQKACDVLLGGESLNVPEMPARNVVVLHPKLHPPKKGLSTRQGQLRLLHDLANIELQAMELGLRTLAEFPQAPFQFREELAQITKDEAKHFALCLDAMEALGGQWGDIPVHLSLWNATSKEDSLLDRILIVHRYLEGSGIDAGDTFLRRLDGIAEGKLHGVVRTIFTEEIGHVQFGSRWYFKTCQSENVDAEIDFPERMEKLHHVLPRRIETISREQRLKAGFTESEIQYLVERRQKCLTM